MSRNKTNPKPLTEQLATLGWVVGSPEPGVTVLTAPTEPRPTPEDIHHYVWPAADWHPLRQVVISQAGTLTSFETISRDEPWGATTRQRQSFAKVREFALGVTPPADEPTNG